MNECRKNEEATKSKWITVKKWRGDRIKMTDFKKNEVPTKSKWMNVEPKQSKRKNVKYLTIGKKWLDGHIRVKNTVLILHLSLSTSSGWFHTSSSVSLLYTQDTLVWAKSSLMYSQHRCSQPEWASFCHIWTY